MAQRMEKEETEFKVPETIFLCVNNCCVIGNPATNNMCQKCFNATATTTTTTTTSSVFASTTNLKSPISTRTSRLSNKSNNNNSPSIENSRKTMVNSSRSTAEKEPDPAKRMVNRCSGNSNSKH